MTRKSITLITLITLLLFLTPAAHAQTSSDWYMAGANPQRTSRLETTPTTNLDYIWFRPIEAYIPQNVNIIAVNNQLYLATANGLLVFNANNGQLNWRFNTDMPLGHSPTVKNGYVFVAGYDRKVHILDTNGNYVTSYDQANAGYSTNPLVVERNGTTWVYLGDRNGIMHAFTFNGSTISPRWTFQAGHSGIHYSAAYHNNTVYFASNDNYAYALNADTGSQTWKSQKLPGWGFYSWWPVIHTQSNSVIFARGASYRSQRAGSPGSHDLDVTYDLQLDLIDIFNGSSGVVNIQDIRQYFANKPWRRSFIFLDLNSGAEHDFSSSGGAQKYAPFGFTNTKNGNLYPPVIGADGDVYSNSLYDCSWDADRGTCSDSKGQIFAWDPTSPDTGRWLSPRNANTEPQAVSAAGDFVFRNLCCGRIASAVNIFSGSAPSYWNYTLDRDPPQGLGIYYDMWVRAPRAISFHTGWYQGSRDFYPQTLTTDWGNLEVNTVNGLYHTHGDQNPLVYHQGKLFTHRHNTIIALGTGTDYGRLAAVPTQSSQSTPHLPTDQDLINHLESQVSRMVNQGHFRPAYDLSKVGNYNNLDNYFENPGDTLWALAAAYPYLSSSLKNQVTAYLSELYSNYFQNQVITSTGWANLADRQGAPIPPDTNTSAGPNTNNGSQPHSAYGLYLYAKNVDPNNTTTYYQKAAQIIPNSYPSILLPFNIFDYNQWMTGYHGLLNLHQLAGYSDANGNCSNECNKFNAIQNNLSQMQQERRNNFSKDSPYMNGSFYRYYHKPLDVARNFMYLSPELGQWYRNTLYDGDAFSTNDPDIEHDTDDAIVEYDYTNPYWFAHHHNAWMGEGTFQVYYTTAAMFQAKAWIEQAPRDELAKYLDAPAYEYGDLFYIQNLITVLNASDEPPPPPPAPGDYHPYPEGDNDVDIDDFWEVIQNFLTRTYSIFNFNQVISNFGT